MISCVSLELVTFIVKYTIQRLSQRQHVIGHQLQKEKHPKQEHWRPIVVFKYVLFVNRRCHNNWVWFWSSFMHVLGHITIKIYDIVAGD